MENKGASSLTDLLQFSLQMITCLYKYLKNLMATLPMCSVYFVPQNPRKSASTVRNHHKIPMLCTELWETQNLHLAGEMGSLYTHHVS